MRPPALNSSSWRSDRNVGRLPFAELIRALRSLARSQAGFDFRHSILGGDLDSPAMTRLMRMSVGGGQINLHEKNGGNASKYGTSAPSKHYFLPRSQKTGAMADKVGDLVDRTGVVFYGLNIFVDLIVNKGVYPGHGGYELTEPAHKSSRSHNFLEGASRNFENLKHEKTLHNDDALNLSPKGKNVLLFSLLRDETNLNVNISSRDDGLTFEEREFLHREANEIGVPTSPDLLPSPFSAQQKKATSSLKSPYSLKKRKNETPVPSFTSPFSSHQSPTIKSLKILQNKFSSMEKSTTGHRELASSFSSCGSFSTPSAKTPETSLANSATLPLLLMNSLNMNKEMQTGNLSPSSLSFPSKKESLVSPTTSTSRERTVPSSRFARAANFGVLALGLGAGALAEAARRTVLGSFSSSLSSSRPSSSRDHSDQANTQSDSVKSTTLEDQSPQQQVPVRHEQKDAQHQPGPIVGSVWLSPGNAERIVQTLCRVRGAALKLGQMLSIQDEETVPAYLLDVFERVRQSADFMPPRQVHGQMERALGPQWRSRFAHFEDYPFAAASIGQVHEAVLVEDGRHVAVKVQYPGVADGIDSDIDNLLLVLNNFGRFIPRGLYLDNFAAVARRELRAECDYEREARAMRAFRALVSDSLDYYVPAVVDSLSARHVLTAELIVGGTPVDQLVDTPQSVRDYVATKYIELCLKEVFVWRFMQTDPNWSNFLFGPRSIKSTSSSGNQSSIQEGEETSSSTCPANTLYLLDFGAARTYAKRFIDTYMRIIRAAYDSDMDGVLHWSRQIGFLTGFESQLMEKAHCESVAVIGECLTSRAPFNFSNQNVTLRISKLVPLMLRHRLTAPPDDIYSLHRKLSGAFLLASKLRAKVACGALFEQIYSQYQFDGPDDRNRSVM